MSINTSNAPVKEVVKDFFCSGEVWHEIADKVFYNVDLIWEGLEEDLKIIDYSLVIKRYATFYDCYRPEQTAFHKPEDGWYSRSKKLFISHLI